MSSQRRVDRSGQGSPKMSATLHPSLRVPDLEACSQVSGTVLKVKAIEAPELHKSPPWENLPDHGTNSP